MLIRRSSSNQLKEYPLAKMFLYFEILTLSPMLNLGSLKLESTLYSAKELEIKTFFDSCHMFVNLIFKSCF